MVEEDTEIPIRGVKYARNSAFLIFRGDGGSLEGVRMVSLPSCFTVLRKGHRVSKYGIFLRQSNAAALSVTVVLVMPLVPMLTLVNDSWQGVTKL